jgi:hypothetical protein
MAAPIRVSKQRRIFNFLKPAIPAPTGWDKVYDWLIGRARVVMIVAEVVVAFTFITKVIVDTQAKALEDEIRRKDIELAQFELSTEPVLRSLQNKARTYKKLWNSATQYGPLLSEINAYVLNPGSDLLITFNNTNILISGEENLDSLSQIEAAMKGSASLINPTITSLDAETVEGGSGEYQLTAGIANLTGRTKLE